MNTETQPTKDVAPSIKYPANFYTRALRDARALDQAVRANDYMLAGDVFTKLLGDWSVFLADQAFYEMMAMKPPRFRIELRAAIKRTLDEILTQYPAIMDEEWGQIAAWFEHIVHEQRAADRLVASLAPRISIGPQPPPQDAPF